jgi:hypothetical protein
MKSNLGLDESKNTPQESAQHQYVPYNHHIQSSPNFRCPYCQSNVGFIRDSKISTGGWIVFVLLLFMCFPLCWLGFFITDKFDVCGSCAVRLN